MAEQKKYTCEYCGKIFKFHKKRRFCSKPCSARFNAQQKAGGALDYKATKKGCLELKRAYKAVTVKGKRVSLTRHLYEKETGKKLRKDLLIVKTCNNKKCYNVKHFKACKPGEIEGRGMPGESNGRHKLTAEIVKDLRKGIISVKQVMKKYKVSQNTVTRAKNKLSWKNLR